MAIEESSMAPLQYEAYAQGTAQGLRNAAARFIELGGRATSAVVSWQSFNALLDCHRPGEAGTNTAFPAPGVFVQTHSGWMHVTPDVRLAPGRGIVRDTLTGQAIEVLGLPEN